MIGPPGQLAGTTLQTTVLADASAFAPAFLPGLSGSGSSQLAWTGINGGHSLNVADLGVASNTGTFTGQITGRTLVAGNTVSGTSGPALERSGGSGPLNQVNVVDQNGNVIVASESSELGFDPPFTLGFIAGTRGPVHGIADADGAGSTLWVWTAADGALSFALSNPAISGVTVARSAQASGFAPSVTNFNAAGNPVTFYVAWTGIDGTGLLNVAPFDLAAVRAGTDPVSAVNTLSETSIAAPALVNLSVRSTLPHRRLRIFWTGTDGTGALNGAVVSAV